MRCPTRLCLTVLLLVAAEARDVSTLLAERARCEEHPQLRGAVGDDADGCSPQQYVEILVALGDEHLQLSDREDARESYEMAAKQSFVMLGKDSTMHSKALLRLASHELNSGKYEAANRLLAGWLRTYTEQGNADQFDVLDVLAKQAEALTLGGQLALAKPALVTLLDLLARGGDAVDHFGRARSARMHMFMAEVLQDTSGGEGMRLEEARQHLDRALELHKADAGDGPTSVEASMCANIKAALYRTPLPALTPPYRMPTTGDRLSSVV